MTLRDELVQPLYVSAAEVDANTTWPMAIAAARTAATARSEGSSQTQRSMLAFEGGWMRLMAAEVKTLGVFGYKEFHLAADNTVRYVTCVFDTATGQPRGIVDAALITTLRTAATAAVAVEAMSRSDTPVRLGVVGTGAEALAGVQALSEVIKIDRVAATSRKQENRDAFVRNVNETTGLEARSFPTVAEALADADVAYVATNSGGVVVLDDADVANVPLVASIGSTLPTQRELAGDVLVRADRLVIDTPDVLDESGDAIEAREVGLDVGSVELLGDALEGGATDARRCVYKSIGSPEQDLVLAAAILGDAAKRGYGTRIAPLASVKENL